MSIQEDYTEKSNEELLQMYGSTHSLEIKQELVMRYLYVVKSIALQMRDISAFRRWKILSTRACL